MQPKSVLAILIIGIGVVFFFAWGRSANAVPQTPAAGESGAASPLVASETLYDFGTISMKDGNVTKEFTVSNPTSDDLFLSTVLTSCMCTSAFIVRPDGELSGPFKMPGMGFVPPANETIKAGESRIIRVVYDPNAHGPAGVGPIARQVTLTLDNGAALNLGIKALVTP